ncbi:MAG: 50S ribosomal protein L3 [Acidobacteria bacterium]|nr:MAG: 50S ribosomal protein L3 [Acidobacteriota bacterium]
MVSGLIGKKVGMTQVFGSDGKVIPVTVLQVGPCLITQIKSKEKDGYVAVQLGFVEPVSGKKVTKPLRGHFDKASVPPLRRMREFKIQDESAEVKLGQRIKVDVFQPQEKVDVIGVSKGKGFAGVVKRHHFRGGDATHGSMFHRAPGSIGGSSFPSRVFPGMRAGGHMGHEQVTLRNLTVVEVDPENNLMLVEGAVPGPKGSYIVVRRAKSGHRAKAIAHKK